MQPMMELTRFRVESFRSVEDSGWIDVDDVTALIGTNESGKTNLLLPLWKLNPAQGGEIHPTSDFPRKHFTRIRNAQTKPVFIHAMFTIQEPLRKRIAMHACLPEEEMGEVIVRRRLDGEYEISFPLAPPERTVAAGTLKDLLESARSEIGSTEPMKSEAELFDSMINAIDRGLELIPNSEDCGMAVVAQIRESLAPPSVVDAPKTSSIAPRFQRLCEEIETHNAALEKPHPNDCNAVRKLIFESLPRIIYYSTYGNLDSEIYLPHVIENLGRDNLGQKERAKARTLKVLFDFVELEPTEILELGKDPHADDQRLTDKEVAQVAEKKKERSILLQSASTRLTDEFRKWWRQGDYRFRFEADGDHFRIWVSDDRRPEEIELEGRSAGLQWFLSFYLVFLVESQDTHADCILLLDEPGQSLHPLAQRDLSDFFDGLAQYNRLLYTTHSPFLVDADRLDRARKVYVALDGTSKATPDLGADDGDLASRGAGYAVHAALGLSIAEGLLIGCEPVVVEGPSDQHYLTAMKIRLIADGSVKPGREIVFPPAGGAKGIKAVASILGGRDGLLPTALLDSDEQGTRFARNLRAGLYAADPGRVMQVGDYVRVESAEVEDLMPVAIIVREVDRMIREPAMPFGDTHDPTKPIVRQIETWAKDGGANLPKGWKVELAKRVKRALLEGAEVPSETLAEWANVFGHFQSGGSPH